MIFISTGNILEPEPKQEKVQPELNISNLRVNISGSRIHLSLNMNWRCNLNMIIRFDRKSTHLKMKTSKMIFLKILPRIKPHQFNYKSLKIKKGAIPFYNKDSKNL